MSASDFWEQVEGGLLVEACPIRLADFMPCHDPKRAKLYSKERNFYRERHCPPVEEKLRCLIPPLPDYQIPVRWPQSLQKVCVSFPHSFYGFELSSKISTLYDLLFFIFRTLCTTLVHTNLMDLISKVWNLSFWLLSGVLRTFDILWSSIQHVLKLLSIRATRCWTLLRRPQSFTSFLQMWFNNTPHNKIAELKADQGWMTQDGDFFTFPGGGTMFPNGAEGYVQKLEKYIPIGTSTIRTALDIGCGVRSSPSITSSQTAYKWFTLL